MKLFYSDSKYHRPKIHIGCEKIDTFSSFCNKEFPNSENSFLNLKDYGQDRYSEEFLNLLDERSMCKSCLIAVQRLRKKDFSSSNQKLINKIFEISNRYHDTMVANLRRLKKSGG
jgi:hypothetical protein